MKYRVVNESKEQYIDFKYKKELLRFLKRIFLGIGSIKVFMYKNGICYVGNVYIQDGKMKVDF